MKSLSLFRCPPPARLSWPLLLSGVAVALVGCNHNSPATGILPAPLACQPELDVPIPDDPGRSRTCVLDVGSRNVKLIIASLQPGDPLSLRDERRCRTRMQLGEKTFDQKSRTPQPLPEKELHKLTGVLKDYVAQCQRDGGKLLAAGATEWARRATNQAQILAAVKSETGVDLEILTREKESQFGYLAATKGVTGKIVLDFGSRSVQLSFWPRGTAKAEAISLPLGIDEAGDRYFSKADHPTFSSSRTAYLAAVQAGLGELLTRMKTQVQEGKLAPELYSLGENGDMSLTIRGLLWDPTTRQGVDEVTYSKLVHDAYAPTAVAPFGVVTAVLPVESLRGIVGKVDGDDRLYNELRSDRVKRYFGNKVLAFSSLVGLLSDRLGLDKVVLVPQEMSDGFIIEKVAR